MFPLPRLDRDPFWLTSFGVGSLYVTELEHLIQSVKRVYNGRENPTILVGRLVDAHRIDVIEIEDVSEVVVDTWNTPTEFHYGLDHLNEFDSWWSMVGLKGWWIYRIFDLLLAAKDIPLVWLDADARVQKMMTLDVPRGLGAHWVDFENRSVLHSGTLVMSGGGTLDVLSETYEECRKAAGRRERVGHQEILQRICLRSSYPLYPLPDAYCSISRPESPPDPDATIVHWNAHRHRIDPTWPPPEIERVSSRFS